MPPARAIAIAISASVTVSIAAETSGMLSGMFLVKRLWISTFFGCTADCRGTSSTSSKVRACVSRKVPIAEVTPAILNPQPAGALQVLEDQAREVARFLFQLPVPAQVGDRHEHGGVAPNHREVAARSPGAEPHCAIAEPGDLVGVFLGGEKIVLGRPRRDAKVYRRAVEHV